MVAVFLLGSLNNPEQSSPHEQTLRNVVLLETCEATQSKMKRRPWNYGQTQAHEINKGVVDGEWEVAEVVPQEECEDEEKAGRDLSPAERACPGIQPAEAAEEPEAQEDGEGNDGGNDPEPGMSPRVIL